MSAQQRFTSREFSKSSRNFEIGCYRPSEPALNHLGISFSSFPVRQPSLGIRSCEGSLRPLYRPETDGATKIERIFEAFHIPADHVSSHKAATDEFIRRFMLHILPKGFHRIRHYGLFANTGRAAHIARLRELLGCALPPAEKGASSSQDEPAETVLPPCPCCGGRMIVIESFERGTQPRYRQPFATVIWFDTS